MKKIDTETAKKVMDILSNPEMMSKISAIASGSSQTASVTPFSPDITEAAKTPAHNSRAELLLAIKPFLKEEKRDKIDAVIKAITIATTVSKLKGGGTANV